MKYTSYEPKTMCVCVCFDVCGTEELLSKVCT